MKTAPSTQNGPNVAYLDSLECMRPEELVAIGQNLYGAFLRDRVAWQTRLARAIGVNTSTIRNWAKGRHPISASDSRYIRLHYYYAMLFTAGAGAAHAATRTTARPAPPLHAGDQP